MAVNNFEPSDWIMTEATQWPTGAKILDFAAGSGRNSYALKARFGKKFDILAVDKNVVALNELVHKSPEVSVLLEDLETENLWSFSKKKFDVIIVTNYLYRIKLHAIFELVEKGGFIAYETFGEGNEMFGSPKNPDFLVKEGELVTLLPNDFTILNYFHGRVNSPRPAIIQRLSARRLE